MALLAGLILPFQLFNDVVLRIGRWISIVAIGAMVAAILIQVFFRYVINNPLPWPDEAARFCMLWMTGFMGPLAYRRGGFVSIDMFVRALPRAAGAGLSLFLLLVALIVLVTALPIGLKEVSGFNAAFKTASLYYPTFDGWVKMPRVWMSYSFLVCIVLLLVVNVELMLRAIVTMLGGADRLRPIPGADAVGAE